ncbi:MAG TPA: hypothetical protein VHA14_07415, partial [Bryobacteraceae bacterium]|nr:hypothetical protein [Bryobacteraceae bacterium]
MPRLVVLAFFLTAELAWASLAFDGASLNGQPGFLTHILAAWASSAARLLVVFLATAATFSFLDRRAQLTAAARVIGSPPLRWIHFAIHLAAVAVCGWSAILLYGRHSTSPDLLVIAIILSTAAAVAAAA